MVIDSYSLLPINETNENNESIMTAGPVPTFRATKNGGALYMQVARWIQENISAGVFKPGERLPTVRALSEHLGVNRGLVSSAYAHLSDSGIVDSHVGRGTFVAKQSTQASSGGNEVPIRGTRFWDALLGPSSVLTEPRQEPISEESRRRLTWVPEREDARDEASLIALDIPLANYAISRDLVHRTMRKVADEGAAELFSYSDPQGLYSLRVKLAELANRKGINASPESLMVTSGAQQAFSLISGLLLDKGDIVVTEDPTYLGAIRSFRSAGARVIGIPMDSEGIAPDPLEDTLRRNKVKLIYTIPSFQAPTGTTQSPTRRRQLYQLALKYGVPILEDGYVNDLYYGKAPPAAIRAIDVDQIVIYVGTFSKTLSAGIRLGWISASPKLIARLVSLKESRDIQSSALSQLIVSNILENSLYETLLARLRRHYGQLYQTLMENIMGKLDVLVPQQSHTGGFSIWVGIPRDVPADDWLAYSRAEGVPFDKGSQYFVEHSQRNFARLCFSLLSADDIEKAVNILAQTMQKTRGIHRNRGTNRRNFLPFS